MTPPASSTPSLDAASQWVFGAVFSVGFSCVLTQLALMREMLGVFAGNELILGVALGNWLLLMGLGAAAGRWAEQLKHPIEWLGVLFILLAVLPLVELVALRGLHGWVFLPGTEVGVVQTVIASLLVLLPYCLGAGFFLTLACHVLVRQGHSEAAGRVYALDGAGSVLGGVLFSFFLARRSDHFTILCLAAMLNLLAGAGLAGPRRGQRTPARKLVLLAACAMHLAGIPVLLGMLQPDQTFSALQFSGQRILFCGNSSYGRWVVTESGGQTNFIENGVVLAATPDIEQAEENVHYALAQRPRARKVLFDWRRALGRCAGTVALRFGRAGLCGAGPLGHHNWPAFSAGKFPRYAAALF